MAAGTHTVTLTSSPPGFRSLRHGEGDDVTEFELGVPVEGISANTLKELREQHSPDFQFEDASAASSSGSGGSGSSGSGS